jgi:hypothetical protein
MAHYNPQACESYCCTCHCDLWQDGCFVYWNCPRANGRAIKVSIIIGSSQQLWSTASSGVINAIVGNTYRVECYSAAENDYVITAEIEVTAIPSNCCQNPGGLSCEQTLGSLSQITATISNVTGTLGGDCTDIEGTYVLAALTNNGITYGWEYYESFDPLLDCGNPTSLVSITIAVFSSGYPSTINPQCNLSYTIRLFFSSGVNVFAWSPSEPCSLPKTSSFLLLFSSFGGENFNGTLRLEP